MKKFAGSTAMIIATIFWGVAFSAQSAGMDHIKPMLFTALRSLVGAAALVIVMMLFDLWREKRLTVWGAAKTSAERRTLLTGGIFCGVIITFASGLQQAGLQYTSAGKTGFLTALYIIIVPLLGLFFKRKATILLYIAAVMALAGTYLLCGGVSSIGTGEYLVMACALVYSFHVLVIDRYAPRCDCVRLSCIQFVIATVLSAIISLILREPWIFNAIKESLVYWVFCGVCSSALAFTLQMVAQKYLHPVTATLLMSLESVFAVLGGWLFLNEMLSAREFAGCAVILLAVIIAQLPCPFFSPKKSGFTP